MLITPWPLLRALKSVGHSTPTWHLKHSSPTCARSSCNVSILHMQPELTPSILSFMRACYMGFAFQIVQTPESVFVRSHHSLSSKTWAEFSLDGIPRVHRVFPNGETTLASLDGLLHGDYVADSIGDVAVALTLFSWPASPMPRLCYAIHILIARAGTTALSVDVRIAAARELSPVEDYLSLTVNELRAFYDEPNESLVVALRLDYDKQRMESSNLIF
ncbi:hypothetical protein AC1031_017061 [Aphanomyces cochlioides]|nr:hypothetical protein AC1031_017061 [Aphanomyces cochlioides]